MPQQLLALQEYLTD